MCIGCTEEHPSLTTGMGADQFLVNKVDNTPSFRSHCIFLKNANIKPQNLETFHSFIMCQTYAIVLFPKSRNCDTFALRSISDAYYEDVQLFRSNVIQHQGKCSKTYFTCDFEYRYICKMHQTLAFSRNWRSIILFVGAARAAKMPISILILKHEALRIRDKIIQGEASQDTKEKLSAFCGRNSWLQAFIWRKALRSVRINGEAGSVVQKLPWKYPSFAGLCQNLMRNSFLKWTRQGCSLNYFRSVLMFRLQKI